MVRNNKYNFSPFCTINTRVRRISRFIANHPTRCDGIDLTFSSSLSVREILLYVFSFFFFTLFSPFRAEKAKMKTEKDRKLTKTTRKSLTTNCAYFFTARETEKQRRRAEGEKHRSKLPCFFFSAEFTHFE